MPVNIIAEIGWNFMGDMDLARKMIESAKNSGADICKFQFWNPKNLKQGDWDNDGRREIYEKAKLDNIKIQDLMKTCNEFEVNFLTSVFSINDAKLIYSYGIQNIKIPSHESYNLELHEYCIKNFKNIYSSLGACSAGELKSIIKLYKKYKNNNSVVFAMHCVSSYPCAYENLNLPRLSYLKENFDHIGLSDHTDSIFSGAAALSYGVSVIEKHFTTDNSLPGRDNKFAMNPDSFKLFCQGIRDSEKMNYYKGLNHLDVESDIIKNYRGRWG